MAVDAGSPATVPSAKVDGPKLQLPPSCDPPTISNPPQQRVWIIFGATGHLGRCIAKAALGHGDQVTAVGRAGHDDVQEMRLMFDSSESSSQRAKDYQEAGKPSIGPDGPRVHTHQQTSLPLLCDIRLRVSIESVFQQSLECWGRYDIVANCAGYGIIGPCEEQDEFHIRGQFETNFWGPLSIIQCSLPYFRARSEANMNNDQASEDEDDNEADNGRYLIFSSISGSLGVPGLGPYCATKNAVEGLVESMSYETAGFGIRATLVEPGFIRHDNDASNTPARTRSMGKDKDAMDNPPYGHFYEIPRPAASAYASAVSPANHARRVLQWLGDGQPTSATKAAEIVWQLGHCRFPPLRLLLGALAMESVREKLRNITEEIEDWKWLNFPNGDEIGENGTPRGNHNRGTASQSESDNDDGHDDNETPDDVNVKMELEEDNS